MSILNKLAMYIDDGYLLHGSPNISIKVLEPRQADYREDKICGVFATNTLKVAVGCAVIAKRCADNCITDIDNPLFFESMGMGRVYVCPPETFTPYGEAFISKVSVVWIDAFIISPQQDEIFTMLFGIKLTKLRKRHTPVHTS